MASKALTCSAASVMPNKASLSPASLGSAPRSVLFSSPIKSSSSASKGLLAVRAQQYGGEPFSIRPQQYGGDPFSTGPQQLGAQPFSSQQGAQPFSSTNQVLVHTPWYTTEDETAIKMRIDVPGVSPEDLDVKVEGNMLVIKDLGRQLFSPYDTKIQLPPDCFKEQVQALLKNGVLHVSVPKRFPPSVHIPIRASPY